MRAKRRQGATVFSSGRVFNDWLSRARADIALLDDRAADRPLPLCRHPLVLHGVRTRRRHLRVADAVARSGAGARRAGISCAAPGDGDLAVQRFAARQDHARDPQGRDGGAARTAVRALLRRRRHDPALHLPRLRLRRPHRRHGLSSTRCGRRSSPRLRGWRRRASRTATASSPTSAPPIRGCPTRAGRTASIPSSMPTAASRRGRSRWSRCKATSTRHIAAWPIWRRGAKMPTAPRIGRPAPKGCAQRSNGRSGWRTPASTRSRSTETASLARSGHPMPGIFSMPACRRRSGHNA